VPGITTELIWVSSERVSAAFRRQRRQGRAGRYPPAMHEQLAYGDAYARSIEGRVVAVHDAATEGTGALVVLDRTVFYPGGGGQPADRGTLLRASDGRTWTVASARNRLRVEGPDQQANPNRAAPAGGGLREPPSVALGSLGAGVS
jgi:hypothetical protein